MARNTASFRSSSTRSPPCGRSGPVALVVVARAPGTQCFRVQSAGRLATAGRRPGSPCRSLLFRGGLVCQSFGTTITGVPMYPPPSIHSSELRPGRGWYFFAALLAIILIAVGVGGFGYGVF